MKVYLIHGKQASKQAKIGVAFDIDDVVLVNKIVTYFDLFVGPFKRRDMSLMTRVPNFIL